MTYRHLQTILTDYFPVQNMWKSFGTKKTTQTNYKS